MNIEEGNKFIAKFMGGELVEFIDLSNSNCTAFKMNNSIYPFYSLAYHSSWDWLMPVVEKIESLGCKFQICRRQVNILKDEVYPLPIIERIKEETKLQSVWQAVIQFIEWYNKEQSVKESDTTKAT